MHAQITNRKRAVEKRIERKDDTENVSFKSKFLIHGEKKGERQQEPFLEAGLLRILAEGNRGNK
jgi:hypothetical protein